VFTIACLARIARPSGVYLDVYRVFISAHLVPSVAAYLFTCYLTNWALVLSYYADDRHQQNDLFLYRHPSRKDAGQNDAKTKQMYI
jgi:hypothetical protein